MSKKKIKIASNFLDKASLGLGAAAAISAAIPGVDLISTPILGTLAGVSQAASKILKLFGGNLNASELKKMKRIDAKLKKHKANGGSFSSMIEMAKGKITRGDIKYIQTMINKYGNKVIKKVKGGSTFTGGKIKTKRKTGSNKWLQALKLYNKGKKEWMIPRKGTSEYTEVKRIQASL